MGSHRLEGVTPWGADGGRAVFNVEGQVPKLKERSLLPVHVNLLPSSPRPPLPSSSQIPSPCYFL